MAAAARGALMDNCRKLQMTFSSLAQVGQSAELLVADLSDARLPEALKRASEAAKIAIELAAKLSKIGKAVQAAKSGAEEAKKAAEKEAAAAKVRQAETAAAAKAAAATAAAAAAAAEALERGLAVLQTGGSKGSSSGGSASNPLCIDEECTPEHEQEFAEIQSAGVVNHDNRQSQVAYSEDGNNNSEGGQIQEGDNAAEQSGAVTDGDGHDQGGEEGEKLADANGDGDEYSEGVDVGEEEQEDSEEEYVQGGNKGKANAGRHQPGRGCRINPGRSMDRFIPTFASDRHLRSPDGGRTPDGRRTPDKSQPKRRRTDGGASSGAYEPARTTGASHLCRVHNCKFVASVGVAGGPKNFCEKHKLSAEVDVRGGLCYHPACERRASYGVAGTTKPEWCWFHTLKDTVVVCPR